MANRRLKSEGLQQGRETVKGELGQENENDKCCLCQVRAQAECLLGWLRHAGREAGVASKRFAEREEEIWARVTK